MELPARDQQMIEKELFGTRPEARARFYYHAALNQDATDRNGYPSFDDRVYVEIRIPDSTDFMSRPASESDYAKFPQAYAHFQRVKDWDQHSLDLLPKVPLSKKATLRALKIHTIEQLAAHEGELPDAVQDVKALAVRFTHFFRGDKPRFRLVNGQLEQYA